MAEALIFYSKVDSANQWRAALKDELPDLQFRLADDGGDPAEVRFALAWEPPPGFFRRYENLQLVTNLGAGVDRLCLRDDLGAVHISRLSDPGMVQLMTSYVMYAVTRYARDLHIFERAKGRGEWHYVHPRPLGDVTVGVLGLGELGSAAAIALAAAGYTIRGWSRSQKAIADVCCLSGADGLEKLLGGNEIIVCMLPLTAATAGLLDRERLALLQPGAKFINVSRGAVVDEAAMIEALREGRIGEATLDVFAVEPLPAGHPLWSLDNVLITPHLASITIPREAARAVAESIRRVRAGQQPLHAVNQSRGY